MRVLFLSQIVPYPPHGGVLQRGFNLIRELGRHATVHLLAFVHPDELRTEDAVAESRRVLGQFCEVVEYFPLWAKTSPAHRAAALALSAVSSQPYSVIAHRSSAFRRRTAAALAAGGVDLVHADTIALCQFVDPRSALPRALTHHNVESVLMERRAAVDTGVAARTFLQRDSAKLRALEATESPRYDVNIMVSAVDAAVLGRHAPGVRTAVVPNGVDIEYFTPDPSQETPALVYTGGMNMFANRDAVMHFVTEIWPLVAAQDSDAKFYAVGQDPPPELAAIAARDPRIVVTGYVSDIRPFVRQSAVYVVPLRVGGGTRLKVLDAMATGKAMVSTSIGCEGIEAVPGQHLLIADEPGTFAAATLELLRNPARRLALGQAARALVERTYAWPIIGRRLLDAYSEAIDRRRTMESAAR